MNRRVGVKLSRKGHDSSFYKQPSARQNHVTVRGDEHLAKLDAVSQSLTITAVYAVRKIC